MENKKYIANIPETSKTRIVIVGGGFAGLKFLKKIKGKDVQLILLDKNNFHQFQPLLYQVATAGLEPSAISFPLRKILQNEKNIHFRIAELLEVMPSEKEIRTNIGYLNYDHLILAMGADTNFYGQKEIENNALAMKSAADAIHIRNTIVENFEAALLQESNETAAPYMNIVLVGGGPTGVELAGAIAEMKKYIFPKDYPELDISQMRIVLYESSDRLLSGMSKGSSDTSVKYLENMGVEVRLNTRVNSYDGTTLELSDGASFESKTVIWAAGIKSISLKGLPAEVFGHTNRLKVDRFSRLLYMKDIYVIGDNALMETPKYPEGHPQIAQAAIQQASNLGINLKKWIGGKKFSPREFEYRNKGSMATIGRHLAVADLPGVKLKGYIAWMLWSFVHLFTIFGLKNKIQTFISWTWHYFTYDQSLRLLIRHKPLQSNKNLRSGNIDETEARIGSKESAYEEISA